MAKEGFQKLLKLVNEGLLIAATLSSPKEKGNEVLKLTMRPVKVQGSVMVQVSEHKKQSVVHKNVTFRECSELIQKVMPFYKQGVFKAASDEFHLLVGKEGKMTVIVRKREGDDKLSFLHNSPKKYILSEGTPIPFLIHLGVMTKDGKVVAKRYDKFRQINRFLELIRDIVGSFPKDRPLRIVDFGSGKAYLTFALYHYLHVLEGFDVEILGLDLKEEVVKDCQNLAKDMSIKHLKFDVADIKTVEIEGDIDMMISLHACDTATDAALAKAVSANAKVILCVPCCQHELYSQVKSEVLQPILRYGILKERFAAIATDAARAEALAISGYDVDVLEFIDMEHTPKNLAIRAVKSSASMRRQERQKSYHLFKQFLNIDISLDRWLTR